MILIIGGPMRVAIGRLSKVIIFATGLGPDAELRVATKLATFGFGLVAVLSVCVFCPDVAATGVRV
jgi:hypothetical protein